jgi:3-isopropylmalate dehydratase small subunit
MNKTTIEGFAFKINKVVPARDIVPNTITSSYHNPNKVEPFMDLIPFFMEESFNQKILVSEDNFGYGSSKELPANILKHSGIRVIIAKSFFYSFYKNAFNVGLICIETNTDYIDHNDELLIDIKQAFIRNLTRKLGIKFKPLKKYFYKMYLDGGILNQLKKGKNKNV